MGQHRVNNRSAEVHREGYRTLQAPEAGTDRGALERATYPPRVVSKPCAWCGRTDSRISEEHVIARSFKKDCPPPGPAQSPTLVLRDAVRGKEGIRANFDITSRFACRDCNSGWMNALDQEVRPIVRPMILGEPTRLSVADQHVLSRWAVKVAMAADFTHPDELLIRSEELHRFYAEREPTPESRVWLA